MPLPTLLLAIFSCSLGGLLLVFFGVWVGRKVAGKDAARLFDIGQGLNQEIARLREDARLDAKERSYLEEALANHKESHERVVAVLIQERDQWQAMHHRVETDFLNTSNWYEGQLQRALVLLKRELPKLDEAKRKELLENARAQPSLSRPSVTPVTKDPKGMTVLADTVSAEGRKA